MPKKYQRKKCLHTTPRYWYHISTTLRKRLEYLTPWDNFHSGTVNRSCGEPNTKRVCVSPSVEHCLTAVPYCPGDKFTIYRTARKCVANKPEGVHDAHITNEGWIQAPTMFVRVGVLSLPDLAKSEHVNILDESASSNCLPHCGRVLKWWQRRKLQRHIKRG